MIFIFFHVTIIKKKEFMIPKTTKILNILYFAAIAVIIILGIIRRTDILLNEPSFFGDEGALIQIIKRRSFCGLFRDLEFAQSCPSVFLVINKVIYSVFGMNEVALRFTSYFFGLLSFSIIPFFKDILFKNKILNLVLMTALIINYQLLYYSQEFKQYSSDVFFTLLLLLLFFKTKDKINNEKTALIVGIIFASVGYFSFTAEFLSFSICLYLVYKFIKNKTFKPVLCLAIPYFLGLLVQYLLIFKGMMANGILTLWKDEAFAFYSVNDAVSTIRNLTTYLYAEKLCLFLFFAGIIVLLLKDRLLAYLLLMPIALNMISGFLHWYPFTDNRAILYLAPIFMIICIKPLDIFLIKNKILNAIFFLFTLWLVLSLFSFSKSIPKTQIGNENYYFIRSNCKEYIKHLDEHTINPEDKIFVDRQGDGAIKLYYREKNYEKNFIYQSYENDIFVYDYFHENNYYLDDLKTGTHIWFYNTPHYEDSVKLNEINNWIEQNTKILLREKDDMGEFLCVEKIK